MRIGKRISVFFVTLLLSLGIITMPVFAASLSQDGMEVTLITDKNEYNEGEKIEVTLSVKNTNKVAVKNVFLEHIISDGYVLGNGSVLEKSVELLDVGETAELTVVYNTKSSAETEDKTEENSNSNSENMDKGNNANNGKTESKKPSTGDESNIVLWMVITVVAAGGIIVVIAKNKKNGKKILSLFLCLSMIGTIFSGMPMQVKAEEKAQKTINVKENISIGEEEKEVSAIIRYELPLSEMDGDGDQITDDFEDLLGIDSDLDDSDNDGLSDYDEIFLVGTDPALADTDENGIKDGDEDFDSDGICNLDEIKLGTDANRADSENDGLNDNDEVYIYHTDPIKDDSDGDKILDGDEILLGLDPLNPFTDGKTPDGNRLFEQALQDDCIEDSLKEENPLTPSISGNVTGNINKHVEVTEGNVTSLDDNRAVIGKLVEIKTDYEKGTDLRLTFANTDEEERFGFYLICQYVDGEIVPCETVSDGEQISARVGEGTFFVVDTETLLVDLDIPIEKYKDVSTIAMDTEEKLKATTIEAPSNDVSNEWYDENYVIVNQQNNIVDKESKELQAQEDKVSILEEELGEGEELVLASTLNQPTLPAEEVFERKISGQADIVFVIDTTGSMSGAINNVVSNIDSFVDTLQSEYSVKAKFALIDYKDITNGESTTLVKNGSSAWFSDVTSFKSQVNSLVVSGGGDTAETPIDGLAMAQKLNFRQNANKFVILVTDANYKTDNSYGISSMDVMEKMLHDSGIVTSVISSNSYEPIYHDLYSNTGGVFGDIYGDFKSVLFELAEKIGEVVNDGSWVLLSDYQFIKLKQPLDEKGGNSDEDSLLDVDELGEPIASDVTPYINWVLKNYNIPEGMYDDPTTVNVYKYKSNPILTDSDFDGISDDKDSEPKNGQVDGKFLGHYNIEDANYTVDFREFFNSNTKYSNDLCSSSLTFANTIYDDYGFSYNASGKKITSIKELMEYHGFESVINYKLANGYNENGISVSAYKDDDISEIGIGYHTVEYKGNTKTVLGIVIRGTNGTIEEWSSNFDMGNPNEWESEYHKGFLTTEERIREFVSQYERVYLSDKSNIVYWITGHSRGAALANILAAKLVNEEKNVFAYTFATPSTTISSSKNNSKYNCIFNFANTSDFVTYVPLKEWGFGCFGITKELSIEDSGLEKEWCNQTGAKKYNALNKNVITLATSRIAKSCSKNWNEVFDYAGAQNIDDEQYNCISNRAKRYCKLEKRTGLFGGDKGYKLYPSTAFVFQMGAEMLAGSKQEQENVKVIVMELWNSKYSGVILLFLGDAIKNLSSFKDMEMGESLVGDGHAPATYYVLTQ